MHIHVALADLLSANKQADDADLRNTELCANSRCCCFEPHKKGDISDASLQSVRTYIHFLAKGVRQSGEHQY